MDKSSGQGSLRLTSLNCAVEKKKSCYLHIDKEKQWERYFWASLDTKSCCYWWMDLTLAVLHWATQHTWAPQKQTLRNCSDFLLYPNISSYGNTGTETSSPLTLLDTKHPQKALMRKIKIKSMYQHSIPELSMNKLTAANTSDKHQPCSQSVEGQGNLQINIMYLYIQLHTCSNL